MATYGSYPGAAIPFTGWSPTLGAGGANIGSATGTAQFNGITQADDRDVKGLRTAGGRRLRRLLRVLVGNSPGGTATENRVRIKHVTGAPGGLQLVETVPVINRVTTAADVTAIDALLDRVTIPATYPPDLSGNGGAGKQKYMGVG